MNNIIKMGLLTPLLVFTMITIGLFGISKAPMMVNDVFAEKNKEGKISNTDESTTVTISLKNSSEKKCSPLDPRGC